MKYNRDIDDHKINQAKSRTINYVLDNLELQETKTSIFSKVRFKFVLSVMSFLLMVVIGITLLNHPPGTSPIETPSVVELSENDQKKLVEASYLTGNIIVNSLGSSIEQMSYQVLSTVFANKADEFDYYFQMLRPIMEEDLIEYDITVLENETYDYLIRYEIDGQEYRFELSMEEENVQGILNIKGLEFAVDGEVKIDGQNISIELNARSDSNYIKIEYESEVEKDEIEKEYKIIEYINQVLTEREIKISHENEEIKLEMLEIYKQTENTYELTKDTSGSQVIYNLEYEIDEIEGEGTIVEEIVNGQLVYRYHIEEDGKEEDYEYEEHDGDDDEEDDDEDDDDEDDEEDEDDNEEDIDDDTEDEEIE
ncbi:hypothetical protein KHQ88_04340 [Mycoplasmatota bacterium]|nr:hypothetical protein KHQ88_04340 [Mycoplasmatota bacterium]